MLRVSHMVKRCLLLMVCRPARCCQLLWIPAWRSYDVEKMASLFIFLVVFGSLGYFIANLTPSDKSMTSLDLTDTHKKELLKKYIEEKRRAFYENLELEKQDFDRRNASKSVTVKEPQDLKPKPEMDDTDIAESLGVDIGAKENSSLIKHNQRSRVKPSKKRRLNPFAVTVPVNDETKVLEDEQDDRHQEKFCKLYDVTGNMTEEFECITMRLRPSAPICLYSDKEDMFISQSLRHDRMWEAYILKEFQNLLYGVPDLGLIDIGANIGVYSILAAMMGHKVVAVEPFRDSIKRFHKAVQIAQVEDKIIMVENAVSDTRGKARLKMQKSNQGAVVLEKSRSKSPDPGCAKGTGVNCPPEVSTIYMDDLLEVIPFEKAMVKIDIEGYEHRAFVHASKLFDKIYIPYVFMEWFLVRAYYGSEITDTEDKDLTFDLVRFFLIRGYSPYSLITGDLLKPTLWYGWPDNIVWKHELQDFI